MKYFLDKYFSLILDVEPPTISCPTNITIPAEDKLHYAAVRWPDPPSTDNSGFHPLVTSVPVVEFPMKFKIGTTQIRVSLICLHSLLSLIVSVCDERFIWK